MQVEEEIPPLSKEEIIKEYLSQPDYTFISGKAKVDFNSDFGSGKVNLYVRSIKDSLLWIAAKKVSVEVGRVLITTDSIFIINRVDRAYQKFGLEEIQKRYGVSASLPYIQNMILGIPPMTDTTEYWKVNYDEKDYTIECMSENILHKFILDSTTGNITKGQFKEKFIASGNMLYKDYSYNIGTKAIPRYRYYQLTNDKEETITMETNFSKWEVDVTQPIRFSIPSNYTRLY